MPREHVSDGCSPLNAPAPNLRALIQTPPKSHNPCAGVLAVRLQWTRNPRRSVLELVRLSRSGACVLDGFGHKAARQTAVLHESIVGIDYALNIYSGSCRDFRSGAAALGQNRKPGGAKLGSG